MQYTAIEALVADYQLQQRLALYRINKAVYITINICNILNKQLTL